MFQNTVTIVIFSDSPKFLKKSLISVSEQAFCGDVDIFVVDKDYSSENIRLIESFIRCGQLKIRHKREFLLEEMIGDYICFIDDRTLLSRNWLKSLTGAIRNNLSPEVILGNVISISRFHLPKWLPEKAKLLLPQTNFGKKERPLKNYHRVHAPNVIIKKRLLGENRINSENYINELDKLINKLYNADADIIYSADTFSYYFIKDEIATLRYTLKKFFSIGVSDSCAVDSNIVFSVTELLSVIFNIFCGLLKTRSKSNADFLRIYFYKLGCLSGKLTKIPFS